MWTFLLAIDCRKFSWSELNVDILCVSWCLLWPSSHKVWNVIVYDNLFATLPPSVICINFAGNILVYDDLPMMAPPPTYSSLYQLCEECVLTMEIIKCHHYWVTVFYLLCLWLMSCLTLIALHSHISWRIFLIKHISLSVSQNINTAVQTQTTCYTLFGGIA